MSQQPPHLEKEDKAPEPPVEDADEPSEEAVMQSQATEDLHQDGPVPVSQDDDNPVSSASNGKSVPADGRYCLRRNIKPPERFVRSVNVWDEHSFKEGSDVTMLTVEHSYVTLLIM